MNQRIPWVRVVTEAVVIIGSILLAFAIDAWWGEVQDGRRVTASLAGVREELVLNTEELELVAQRHRWLYEAGLGVLSVAVGAAPPDSTFENDARWILVGAMWLDVATEALDRVLVADQGALDVAPELRIRLARYRSSLDQVWQQESMVRNLVRGDLTRELSQRYDLLQNGNRQSLRMAGFSDESEEPGRSSRLPTAGRQRSGCPEPDCRADRAGVPGNDPDRTPAKSV